MRAGLRKIRLAEAVARPLREAAVLPEVAYRSGVVAGLRDEGRELVDGELEPAEREGPCDRDPALRAFIGVAIRLVLRRAHEKRAGRDRHHFGAAGTFAKTVAGFQRLLLRSRERRLCGNRRAQRQQHDSGQRSECPHTATPML